MWSKDQVLKYLHFKKLAVSCTQYLKLSGLFDSYQTKVLSTFASGGIGRKPRPTRKKIRKSQNFYNY